MKHDRRHRQRSTISDREPGQAGASGVALQRAARQGHRTPASRRLAGSPGTVLVHASDPSCSGVLVEPLRYSSRLGTLE